MESNPIHEKSVKLLTSLSAAAPPSPPPSSVQFSGSVVSDFLWPHGLQHARPPCPSPTPGVHPNPCPLSQWCHPTISSSVIPFSYGPQSFQASGSFPMSQLFASGGQSTGFSTSTSVLPMNTQDSSPLGWTGWISLQSKGLSRVFSNTTVIINNHLIRVELYHLSFREISVTFFSTIFANSDNFWVINCYTSPWGFRESDATEQQHNC